MIISWTPGLSLDLLEKMAIQQALRYFRGNKTATCNALGIAERTLYNKLEQYEEEEKRMKGVQDERLRQQREFYERARGVIPAVIDGKRTDKSKDGNSMGSHIAKAKEIAAAPADAGVHVEPASEAFAQPALPVCERQEVQEVLQGEAPASGKKRGRPVLPRTDETT